MKWRLTILNVTSVYDTDVNTAKCYSLFFSFFFLCCLHYVLGFEFSVGTQFEAWEMQMQSLKAQTWLKRWGKQRRNKTERGRFDMWLKECDRETEWEGDLMRLPDVQNAVFLLPTCFPSVSLSSDRITWRFQLKKYNTTLLAQKKKESSQKVLMKNEMRAWSSFEFHF